VVADERAGCRRTTVGGARIIVVFEPQHHGPTADKAAGVATECVVERKVEMVGDSPLAFVHALRDGFSDPRLAEDLEVVDARRFCSRENLGHPPLVELAVDMARGVDAESVELESLDPTAEHFGEAVDHFGLLGVQIVETREVALLDAGLAAASPVDVAAVVVVRGVVHPRRFLCVDVDRQHERLVRGLGLFDESAATHQQNHVAGVVDDHVEIHLHVERVRAVDECTQIVFGAEARVDGGEVDAPVAVVRRAVALHGALHDERGDPDAVEAEVGEALQARLGVGAAARQALQVAAVEKANVGRVEAGDFSRPGHEARVVCRVAVGVAVGHHEIHDARREVGIDDRRGERLDQRGLLGRTRGGLCARRSRRIRLRCAVGCAIIGRVAGRARRHADERRDNDEMSNEAQHRSRRQRSGGWRSRERHSRRC